MNGGVEATVKKKTQLMSRNVNHVMYTELYVGIIVFGSM